MPELFEEPVRFQLRSLQGCRFRCRATVGRFGEKRAFRGPPQKTVLLLDVVQTRTGQKLTDHVWFTVGKWMTAANVRPGDVIEFDATVGTYIKGYQGHREDVEDAPPVRQDWRLERPTRVVNLRLVGTAPAQLELVADKATP